MSQMYYEVWDYVYYNGIERWIIKWIWDLALQVETDSGKKEMREYCFCANTPKVIAGGWEVKTNDIKYTTTT